jgi:vancomycin permeability regulator SanA
VSRIRRHPVLSVLAFALLIVVTVVGLSAVTVWREAHHDDASDVETADAIVVLGAAQYDGTPSPVFKGRLDHALLMYQQGRAQHVFVLGSNQPGDRTTEAASGRDYLIDSGIPASSVESLPVGHTSWESLRAADKVMNERGFHSAFLVSDPWHNARIERMASDLGFRGYASATWTSAYDTQATRLTEYARETFAYLYYRLGGR